MIAFLLLASCAAATKSHALSDVAGKPEICTPNSTAGSSGHCGEGIARPILREGSGSGSDQWATVPGIGIGIGASAGSDQGSQAQRPSHESQNDGPVNPGAHARRTNPWNFPQELIERMEQLKRRRLADGMRDIV